MKKQYSVYELTKVLQSEKLLHFISESNESNTLKEGFCYRHLTELIRIEKDQHYHVASGFDFWLRIRTSTNWQHCPTISGLFKTKRPGIYYGDHRPNGKEGKKNLLVFVFNSDKTKVIIDYYLGYCPYTRPDHLTPELEAVLTRYNDLPIN